MPAITITDLNNAALDAAHIAAIATGTSATATDRLGGVKTTMKGASDSVAAKVAAVEAAKVAAVTVSIPAAVALVDTAVAVTAAGSATAAKVAAESARDAALIQAGVYTTEALGRAAVADGVAFKVQGSGDVAAYEYRRTNSTTSVLIASYPSASMVLPLKEGLILPEQDVYNAITNGNFTRGINGWTGLATRSQPAAGLRLKTASYANHTAVSPAFPLTFAAGTKFLFLYDIDVVNASQSGDNFWATLSATLHDGTATMTNSTLTIAKAFGASGNVKGAVFATAVNAGTAFTWNAALSLYAGTEINVNYLIAVPLLGNLAGMTQAQVEAEIAERGLTGIYFAFGGYARRAINADKADIASATVADAVTLSMLSPTLKDTSLPNKLSGYDMLQGQQSWITNGGAWVWGASGAVMTALNTNPADTAATNASSRFYRVQPLTLLAGHKYAYCVDMDLLGYSGTAGTDPLRRTFTPFINQSLTTFPEKVLNYGVATPVTVRTVFKTVNPLAANETTGNPYFGSNYSRYTSGGQLTYTFSEQITIRSLMIVDLGVAGDPFYDMSEDDLADAIYNLGIPKGTPWGTTTAPRNQRAMYAVNASRASHAVLADVATLANTATLANAVVNRYNGKRFFSYGDSLVSIGNWQNPLGAATGMAYTITGTAGGSIGNPTNGGYKINSVAAIPISPIPDIGIIFHGANDGITGYMPDGGSGGYPLGTPYDEPLTQVQQNAGVTPSTFCQAYNTMLYNIVMRFGQKTRLFLCTQHQYFNKYFTANAVITNGAEVKAQAIREIAKVWGFPLIDLWNDSGINLWNRSMYLNTEDGSNLWVHQNYAGGKRVAEVVYGRLQDVYPMTYLDTDFGSAVTLT